jgi:hypothetical protein
VRLLLLSLATFVVACVIRRTADADATWTLTSRVRSLPASLRTRRLAVSFLWLPQRPAAVIKAGLWWCLSFIWVDAGLSRADRASWTMPL